MLTNKKIKENENFQWAATFFATFAAMYILLRVLFGIAVVNGESMYPTCNDREIVFFNRLADYTYGDVVILESQQLNELIIKRVIGLPGDTIEIKSGTVIRNGAVINESYINSDDPDTTTDFSVTVPNGTVFVLGDNRAHSTDSRYLGCLSDDLVLGVVFIGRKTAASTD